MRTEPYGGQGARAWVMMDQGPGFVFGGISAMPLDSGSGAGMTKKMGPE